MRDQPRASDDLLSDNAVFDAVASRVAAGEYQDTIAGEPGVSLSGSYAKTAHGVSRRVYDLGSADYLEARANGWVRPMPPLTPATPEAVAAAEARIGAPLPPVLRRLYLEVGNGGFGPGYGGICGVDALQVTGRTTLCDWGCAITTELDPVRDEIWGYDPNLDPNAPAFPQFMAVSEWLGRWVQGRLYQPWAVWDEPTGQWRGATDAEYQEAFDADQG